MNNPVEAVIITQRHWSHLNRQFPTGGRVSVCGKITATHQLTDSGKITISPILSVIIIVRTITITRRKQKKSREVATLLSIK